MKKIVISALVVLMSNSWAQDDTNSKIKLSTKGQEVGYAFGVDMGRSLLESGVMPEQKNGIDFDSLVQGLRDAYFNDGKASLLTDDQIRQTLQLFIKEKIAELKAKAEEVAKQNLELGKEFLAKNKQRAEVKTTSSGLQYIVKQAGSGKSPKATDVVKVNYEGRFIDGKVFDASKKPISFTLNRVIKGWAEGLQLMKEGAKYTFFVPSDLAYGESGAGSDIPPNSVLVFDVELLKVGE